MRFLLILIGVGAVCYWAFGKAKSAFFLDEARTLTSKSLMNTGAPPVASLKASGAMAESVRASVGLGSGAPLTPAKPQSSRVVTFKFRKPPPVEAFSQYSALGLLAVCDPVRKSVFLRGPYDVVIEVGDMLQDSDVVPGWCSLRGWVVWVSDAGAKGWEFSSALSATVGGDVLRGKLTGTDLLLNATVGELSAAFRVLGSDSRVSVVQEPHVRLIDSVESRIESLEEVPIPQTTLSNGLATHSIEYKKVGLELVVTPSFLSLGRVRLSVLQTGGVVGRSVVIDGAEIPVLQTQKVSSEVEMSVGQSVLLGGVRSVRSKRVKGFLKDTTELETGTLYVVLATYDDSPRACPPDAVPEWVPSDPFDLGPPPADIDPMVLPAKGWRLWPFGRKHSEK